MTRSVLMIVGLSLLPIPAAGQFSSDFPGVPRGSIPQFGPSQGRFDLDVLGIRSKSLDEVGSIDTLTVSARIGIGRSWRIGANWELGFDASLADGRMVRFSSDNDGPLPDDGMDASVGYALRVGGKFRPFSYVDPDGYGISASVGFAIQPGFGPAATMRREGDSTIVSGAEGAGGIHSARQLMAAVSYRIPRAEIDGAFIIESATASSEFPSPLTVYEGAGVRVAGRYWLTPSFGVGGVFWGSSAPPWRDRLPLSTHDVRDGSFALLLSFGGTMEKGTDLMITSPTGDFGESVSVILRVR